jgi:hypothetical protein
LLVAGFTCAGIAGAKAESETKPAPDVEAKITAAVKAEYPGATIKKVKGETEDGISFYEAKFTSNGKKLEADVMADGTILETEERADIETFPSAAAQAIKAGSDGGKIHHAEISHKFADAKKDAISGSVKVTKLSTPVVTYEAELKKEGKKAEISVGADGTVLESPKWKASEDKEKD